MSQNNFNPNPTRQMLARTRAIVRNPKLKQTDIIEWAFGRIWPGGGEVVIPLPELGCNVSIPKSKDRRSV